MIEFRIFGTPELRLTAGEEVQVAYLQPKRLALLSYLALKMPAGFCRRDTLLALFWPELDEAHARNALSQAVHGIRRALGKEVIISQGTEEIGLFAERFWCDAVAFEAALETHRHTDALDVYKGPLLDGLHLEAAPEFEHWLEAAREHFRRRAREAVTRLVDQCEAEGDGGAAIHWLRRSLVLAPGDENALRRLMEAFGRVGDRVEALRAYETFTHNLEQDFGLSPSAETQNVAARLRASTDIASAPDQGAVPSVAVMPFTNLSADPEQAYFCDGITEEIINALAQIRGLRVVARTSIFAFKNQAVDIRVLAQKLGADAVIEGSVRRDGDRLRITAQLIDATNGYHLWSERYDRLRHDIFSIQDEIAQSIAETLRIELLERPPTAGQAPTVDLDAHILYLKGLFFRRKRTPENLKKACTCFQQAVEIDPRYAQAQAALSFTYTLCGWFLYDVFAPHKAYPLARDAAAKALSLNSQLAEAHLAIAFTQKAYAWDGPAAEKAFKQALALDPDNLNTIGSYASHLVLKGRFEEAIALTRRGEGLDPFWIIPRLGTGVWLMAARRYNEAIARFLLVQEMEPQLFIAPLFLGDAYRFTGRLDEAHVAYTRAQALIGSQPIILGRFGSLYAAQHQPEKALEIIAHLQGIAEKRHVLPCIVASIYLSLGDHDQALVWLEKAYAERDSMLTLLQVWPEYDPLRSDVRFQKLLKDVIG